jgi:hypothetical protein
MMSSSSSSKRCKGSVAGDETHSMHCEEHISVQLQFTAQHQQLLLR